MTTGAGDPLKFYCTRLLVSDFARSWKFYRDVLGLTPQKGHGSPPYGEFVSDGRTVLALFERRLMATAVGLRAGRYATSNVGRALLGFEVHDVDATAKRLRRSRVRLLQPPTDRPDWRLRTIHLRDPDGYLIEVFSNLPAPAGPGQ